MIFSFKEDLILFWKADRIISGQSGLAKSGSQALLGLIFSQLVLLSQYSHSGGVSTVSGSFSHAGPPTSSSICSSSLETPNLNFFQSREIVPVPAVIFCSTFTPYHHGWVQVERPDGGGQRERGVECRASFSCLSRNLATQFLFAFIVLWLSVVG